MAAEYVAENFREMIFARDQVPLGRHTDPMYERLKPRADYIVITKEKVYLIEAKMKPFPRLLDSLLYYRDEFLKDPNYVEHHAKPIVLLFLVPYTWPAMNERAEKLGIQLIVYKKPWIADYLKETYGIDIAMP